MQALPLIEGHPVRDLGLVLPVTLAAGQDGGALLVGQREAPCLRAPALRHVAGDHRAVQIQLAVPVIPHVLRGQIHLDVGPGHIVLAAAPQVIGIAPGIRLIIDGLPLHRLPGLDVLVKLLRLLVLDDRVAVIVVLGGDLNILVKGRVERAVEIPRIVFGREIADELLHLLLIELGVFAVDIHQLRQGEQIQLLLFVAKIIGDLRAGVLIERLLPRHQILVVPVDLGLYA